MIANLINDSDLFFAKEVNQSTTSGLQSGYTFYKFRKIFQSKFSTEYLQFCIMLVPLKSA